MKVPKPRKLPSGTWFIQLRLGGESIPVTAPDDKECIKQAQYVKAEYLAGRREKKVETPESPTLKAAIDTYIESRKNVLSPATIRGYKNIRKNRFQAYMDRPLSSMDSKDWIVACNEEAKECSAKTLCNAWRFVATVIRDATGQEPPKVSLPQIIPNERPFLEPDQIKTFISAVAGTSVEIPGLLALHSLRRSEICALQWENIDFAQRQILVRGAVVPDDTHKFVKKKENKNKSSTRNVPIMIDELYNALSAAKQPSGPVVTLKPDSLRAGINRVCKRAGLPEVGVHGLRHSFASLAFHLGLPEKVTMEIGGWSDNKTMRNIYTHIAKKDRKKYTDKVSGFFKNANENANEENGT